MLQPPVLAHCFVVVGSTKLETFTFTLAPSTPTPSVALLEAGALDLVAAGR